MIFTCLNTPTDQKKLGGGNQGTQPLGGLITNTLVGSSARGMNRSILRTAFGTGCLYRNSGIITSPFNYSNNIGNLKYVNDSSNYIRYRKQNALLKNYNDSSFGGDNHNASASSLMNLRH